MALRRMAEHSGAGRVNYFFRTLVLGALVGLGYLGYVEATNVLDGHRAEVAERDVKIRELNTQVSVRQKRIDGLEVEVEVRGEQIVSLEADVAELDEHVKELDAALSFLKIDHRMARLTVLGQKRGPAGSTETAVRFEELGPDGEALGESAEYSLPGKVAYIESLVIKFGDNYVEQGDVMRGSSICLFRRLFSETQSPDEGFPLDHVGQRPMPYTDDRSPDLVSKLWMRFWDYANDPEEAASVGVRAIHGEAPFIELREGSSYLVELRSSGGLSLTKE